MNWYFAVLRKYAVFSGRARRKEYWYFHFVDFIIILTLTLLSIVLKFNLNSIHIGYILLTLLPRYAVLTRRLHDIGKSGWWIGFPSMPWLVMLSAIATLLLVAPNNPILANNFNISSLSMASVNNQAPTQSAPAPAAGPINNDPAVITNTAPAQNPNVVTSPNLSTKIFRIF